MKKFTERTKEEQDMIRKAYDFEIYAIENDICDSNPYLVAIRKWADGREVSDAIDEALALHFY